MKKTISLKTSNILGSIVCGILWFITGFLSLWDSKVYQIVQLIVLVGLGITMLLIFLTKPEKGDEMSKAHYLKAKAMTYDITLKLILIFFLILMSLKIFAHKVFEINWEAWTLMITGLMQFVSGFSFAKYERNGD